LGEPIHASFQELIQYQRVTGEGKFAWDCSVWPRKSLNNSQPVARHAGSPFCLGRRARPRKHLPSSRPIWTITGRIAKPMNEVTPT